MHFLLWDPDKIFLFLSLIVVDLCKQPKTLIDFFKHSVIKVKKVTSFEIAKQSRMINDKISKQDHYFASIHYCCFGHLLNLLCFKSLI